MEDQASDVWVRGDRMRIQQVVANLLTNAVKYSGEPGRVETRVGREDNLAAVSVTDAGVGMSDAERARVFDMYYRGADSGKGGGGLGLGLYLCKAIVERHGGQIGVESTEGEGSRFYFSLPALEPGRGGEAFTDGEGAAPQEPVPQEGYR
jgi:signal transduction histidine kinase